MRGYRFAAASIAATIATMVVPSVRDAAAQDAAPVAARFGWFEYRGTDGGPVAAAQYRNPILAGFYPDPSVLRVGRDYYLVNSTFSWFPGIPVWHSRDLVNWRQIGNAIEPPEPARLHRHRPCRSGVFAPAISYHAGRFYIVNTCVDCERQFRHHRDQPGRAVVRPDMATDGRRDRSLAVLRRRRPRLDRQQRGPAGGSKYDGHRAIWLRGVRPQDAADEGQSEDDRRRRRRPVDQADLDRGAAYPEKGRRLLSAPRPKGVRPSTTARSCSAPIGWRDRTGPHPPT